MAKQLHPLSERIRDLLRFSAVDIEPHEPGEYNSPDLLWFSSCGGPDKRVGDRISVYRHHPESGGGYRLMVETVRIYGTIDVWKYISGDDGYVFKALQVYLGKMRQSGFLDTATRGRS